MSHASSARANVVRLVVALSLICLILGHQLVYLATYGVRTGAELALTGHDLQWSAAVATVAVLAVGLLAFAVRELLRLSREARPASGVMVDPRIAGAWHLLRDLLALWLPTLLFTLVLFVLVENGERLAAGLPAPGLNVLGAAGYHDSLLIFEIVAAFVTLVAALYRWRREVLVARIAALRRRWPRHGPTAIARRLDDRPRQPAALTLRPPGRAPPLFVAA